MKIKCIVYIFLFVIFGCVSKSEGKLVFNNAFNLNFNYQGRTALLKDSSAVLIGSASSVEFIVEGDSINLHLQSGNNSHNYIVITINDTYQKRYKIESESITTIPLSFSNNEPHKIGVFKATESASGNVIFYGVDAKEISPIINDKKFLIEFIGDSVTCGAAADTSDVPCSTGEYLDQHNAYLAFGPRIARALNVNFLLSSVSGIGIYRNWNDENNEEPIMPQVYDNLYLNTDDTKKYNFSIKPAVVNICLGTNDLSNGDGVKKRLPFNKEKFVSNYIDFVKTVYSHYPATQIVLLNSPMIIGETNDLLVSCLNEVQNYFAVNSAHELIIFELNKLYNSGCSSHPNVEEHKEIGDKLIPFYKNLLNNK
tara:strand:+ start:4697 stop:5800 length:1104 start_codon:yes stop_codon:yes gene_type:complete